MNDMDEILEALDFASVALRVLLDNTEDQAARIHILRYSARLRGLHLYLSHPCSKRGSKMPPLLPN